MSKVGEFQIFAGSLQKECLFPRKWHKVYFRIFDEENSIYVLSHQIDPFVNSEIKTSDMRKIFKIGIAVGLGSALILGLGLGLGLSGEEEDTQEKKDSLIVETENGVIQGQDSPDVPDFWWVEVCPANPDKV